MDVRKKLGNGQDTRTGQHCSIGGSPKCVGIGNAKAREQPGLERFHARGVALVLMVVALRMQHAMDHEMRQVIDQGFVLRTRLGAQHRQAQDDVGRAAGAGIGEPGWSPYSKVSTLGA
jgi:hypothetical protein